MKADKSNVGNKNKCRNKFKGYLNVGGGIVADSKPRREYEETIEKGLAVVEAIKS